MLSLRELQTKFFDSIARLPGAGPVSFDPVFVNIVEGRGQLGAAERIDIYAQMYYARLLEVLRGDFPRVATILGCEQFDAVARAYLAQYPSTNPSLRYLARFLPAFLKGRPETEEFPFLCDLAQLEWLRVAVFDAPDTEPLRIEDLQTVAPDAWPTLTLHTVPAFQLLRSEWPVHEIWKAAEEETSSPECFRQEKTTVRIWREGFTVYHTPMDTVEQTALDCIRAGEPFGTVCAALESLLSAEEVASSIGSLLLRWVEDGLLARSDFPSQ
jgi:hypothetical protein